MQKTQNSLTMRRTIMTLALAALAIPLSGCHHQPDFETIAPHETAFVIPLNGKTSEQAKMVSEQYLKNAQVAAKEIQIPYRRVQWGNVWDATYRPELMVMKVNRSPVTREWTAEPKTGTSDANQAIMGETSDSVDVYLAMTCTAQIPEDKAALFLYRYNGKTLDQIVDNEVRARVHDLFGQETDKVTSLQVSGYKGKIMQAIRKDVEKHFAERGIELTLGMRGGVQYVDEAIQKSINRKIVAKRELEAQADENKRMLMAAAAMTNPRVKEAQLLRMQNEQKMFDLQSKRMVAEAVAATIKEKGLPQYVGSESMLAQALAGK